MGDLLQFPGNFRKSPQQEMAERLAESTGLDIAYIALEGGPVLNHKQISSLYEPIIEMPADCPA